MRMIKRANSLRTLQFDTFDNLRDIEISYGTKLDKKDIKKYDKGHYKMIHIQNVPYSKYYVPCSTSENF